MSPPSASGLFPQKLTIQTPSPPPPGTVTTEMLTPRPISPNSRKRHQSVPEKLTSLLQLPPPLVPTVSMATGGGGGGGDVSGGRVSPMDINNPDSPPVSKKQRSTSDTILYHQPPYGLPQLSPRGAGLGGQHSPNSRHSTSPQPPMAGAAAATSFDGLSALQTHLLQVHHSYGMNRTAQEDRQKRQNRRHRDSQGHSPRRKHSGSHSGGGGGGKNGSVSPISIQSLQSSEGEEGADVVTSPALHATPSPVMSREEEPGNDNDGFRRENSVSEISKYLQLHRTLVEIGPLHFTGCKIMVLA